MGHAAWKKDVDDRFCGAFLAIWLRISLGFQPKEIGECQPEASYHTHVKENPSCRAAKVRGIIVPGSKVFAFHCSVSPWADGLGYRGMKQNETIGANSASFFVCVAACSVASCFRRSSAFAIREGIQLPYLAYESDK